MRKKLNLTTVSNEELKNSKAGARLVYVDPVAAVGMLEPYQCFFHCHCACWDWGEEEMNSSMDFHAGTTAGRNTAHK